MHVKDTLTVNTTTGTPVYSTAISKRRSTQISQQVNWSNGSSLTTAITFWVSNVKEPVLTTDADWVQVTDITMTGPVTATSGSAAVTVGNHNYLWFRTKFVTTNGSGTITVRTVAERT